MIRGALVAAVLAGSMLAGCGGDDDAPSTSSSTPAPAAAQGTEAAGGGAGKDAVTIKTFQFTPQKLTVKTGTTVTFTNQDAILHTVTSGTRKGESDDTPDGTFDLDLKEAGASDTFTFDKAGTYTYYCKVHPGTGMTGEVIVQ